MTRLARSTRSTRHGTGTGTGTGGNAGAVRPPLGPTPRRRRRWPLLLRYAVLVAVLLVMFFPLVWQLLTSLKGPGENIYDGFLPRHPSLQAYRKVARTFPLWSYLGNTLVVAALAVSSNCVFAAMGGYAMSRRGWRGRRAVHLLFVATLMFPFESVMISMFLAVRSMGLIDTLVGVWIPGAVSTLSILIMRTAFLAVPDELEEAAVLDGAGEWRRFWSVYLPQTRGTLAVIAITSFIGAWDDFLWPLIALRSNEHYTLQLGLATLSGSFTNDQRLVAAGSIIALLPIAVLFFALQRVFFQGIADGAVKA
ncbi:carbohydrate ABC transporter permease [Kitasatospora nipponensis]|uniref:Carbohydrate ABC transporter permease n=1 Tax=Kitasatospora nipponensis TaxID=258049 RepID=A0ABN1W912_9ACTN